MRIHVRLGEPFWRVVGQRDLQLEIVPPAQVDDLVNLLQGQYPALEQELAESPPHFFVGENQAALDTPLEDGAHIYLVWAVAGG